MVDLRPEEEARLANTSVISFEMRLDLLLRLPLAVRTPVGWRSDGVGEKIGIKDLRIFLVSEWRLTDLGVSTKLGLQFSKMVQSMAFSSAQSPRNSLLGVIKGLGDEKQS